MVKDSFAVAAHLGGPIATQADSAFIDGVHVALLAAADAAVLAAALVVSLLPRRDAPTPAADETEPRRSDHPPSRPPARPARRAGPATALTAAPRTAVLNGR